MEPDALCDGRRWSTSRSNARLIVKLRTKTKPRRMAEPTTVAPSASRSRDIRDNMSKRSAIPDSHRPSGIRFVRLSIARQACRPRRESEQECPRCLEMVRRDRVVTSGAAPRESVRRVKTVLERVEAVKNVGSSAPAQVHAGPVAFRMGTGARIAARDAAALFVRHSSRRTRPAVHVRPSARRTPRRARRLRTVDGQDHGSTSRGPSGATHHANVTYNGKTPAAYTGPFSKSPTRSSRPRTRMKSPPTTRGSPRRWRQGRETWVYVHRARYKMCHLLVRRLMQVIW